MGTKSNDSNPRKRHDIHIYIYLFIPCKAKHTTVKAWEPAKAALDQCRSGIIVILQRAEARYRLFRDLYRLNWDFPVFSFSLLSSEEEYKNCSLVARCSFFASALRFHSQSSSLSKELELSSCYFKRLLVRCSSLCCQVRTCRWMIGRRLFFSLFSLCCFWWFSCSVFVYVCFRGET